MVRGVRSCLPRSVFRGPHSEFLEYPQHVPVDDRVAAIKFRCLQGRGEAELTFPKTGTCCELGLVKLEAVPVVRCSSYFQEGWESVSAYSCQPAIRRCAIVGMTKPAADTTSQQTKCAGQRGTRVRPTLLTSHAGKEGHVATH